MNQEYAISRLFSIIRGQVLRKRLILKKERKGGGGTGQYSRSCCHEWLEISAFHAILGCKSPGTLRLHVNSLDGRVCTEIFPNPMILKNRVRRGAD